jgi:S1-C subfamily serine protease
MQPIEHPHRVGAARRPVPGLRLLAVAVLALLVGLAGMGLTHATAGTIGNGIVVVDTTLGYAGGEAAGTGMVLTSKGEILTNNHVIEGATALRVVVPGTGRSYSARVVGYSVANDVALLKLKNATNLATVSVGNSAKLRLGQTVTAIGNARGTGNLSTVSGTITGLRKTITAGDGQGNSEQLRGLIETNAAVVSGDSGGPLEDADGKVVGMVTAASASGGFRFRGVSASQAYAIPIRKALAIVRTVRAGKTTSTVHVGPTAFLGVSVTAAAGNGVGNTSNRGAAVAGVADGSPAARAGLQQGDVIVRVDGNAVTDPAMLRARVLRKRPGETLELVVVDVDGTRSTVSVTLASGPPQ